MLDNSLINTILESILKEAMGLNTSSVSSTSLKHALARRMRCLEMDNTLHYVNLIKTSSQELNELIEEVTVHETWFFRDDAPFLALRDYATHFIKKHKDQTLKLLSIPCSTGEEPYSLAMTLIDAGVPSHAFSIDAVDISRRSLALAQKGIFRSHSFRGAQAQQHQRYFSKTKQGYALDKSIKDLVKFHRGNLIHLTSPLTTTTYQVIFCRNLLIYLDTSFHQQTINTFNALLADNGLLVVGHAEAGIFSNSLFTPAPYPKAFAFQKKDTYPLVKLPLGPFSIGAPAAMPPSLPWATDAVANTLTGPKNKTISALEPERSSRHPEPSSCDQAIRACEEQIQTDGSSAEIFYQLATLFEQKSEWQTAITMLKKACYLDPNYLDAIDRLAAIYQRLGDETNYLACLNRGRRIITRLSRPTTEMT